MKKLTVIGAGESGLGAALLAKSKGYQVFVSDAGKISEQRKKMLEKHQIEFEENQHTGNRILDSDEIVKSPGISSDRPLIQKIIEKGIPVIDELELAFRYSRGKIIAITGTNGKTTTSLLTYHLMKKAQLDVGLAGNVGKSWAMQLVENDHDWWVLEVSSFQVEGFKEFKPKVAILLNITPDHLDRYDGDLAKYAQTKLKLIQQMDENDIFIYFNEDENIRKYLAGINVKPQACPVAWDKKFSPHHYLEEEKLVINWGKLRMVLEKTEMILKGKHNLINTMCAIQAAWVAGAAESFIHEGLQDFQNAAHRMETLGEIDGIQFINDSKGTNVDATAYALSAYPQPLIWIAGGVDKGNDYSILYPWVQGHVKLLICLGKENTPLHKAFEGKVDHIFDTQDMEEAVRLGFEKGKPGDVVLLSPACASFDLFQNYEDRGNRFKEAVNTLKNS